MVRAGLACDGLINTMHKKKPLNIEQQGYTDNEEIRKKTVSAGCFVHSVTI